MLEPGSLAPKLVLIKVSRRVPTKTTINSPSRYLEKLAHEDSCSSIPRQLKILPDQ